MILKMVGVEMAYRSLSRSTGVDLGTLGLAASAKEKNLVYHLLIPLQANPLTAYTSFMINSQAAAD